MRCVTQNNAVNERFWFSRWAKLSEIIEEAIWITMLQLGKVIRRQNICSQFSYNARTADIKVLRD